MAVKIAVNFGTKNIKASGARFRPDLKSAVYLIAALVFAADAFLIRVKQPFPLTVTALLYAVFFICAALLEKYYSPEEKRAHNRLLLGLWIIYLTLCAFSGGGDSPLKWAVIIMPLMAAVRRDKTAWLIMSAATPAAFAYGFSGASADEILVYPAALFFSIILYFFVPGAGAREKKGAAYLARIRTQKEGEHFSRVIYGLLESLLKLYHSVLKPVSIILFLKNAENSAEFSMAISVSSAEKEINKGYSFGLQDGLLGAALNKNVFFTFDTKGAQMPYYNSKVPVLSAAVMPVVLDRLTGAIVVDFDRDIGPEKEGVGEKLAKLADETVSVMEINDINYKVISREQRVSLMYEINKKMNMLDGKSALIKSFLEEVRQFDIYSGYIAEYDSAENCFTVTDCVNYPVSAVSTKFSAGEDRFLRYMMDTGKSMLVDDVGKKDIPLNFKRLNIDKSFISLLKSSDTVYGFIKLDKEKPNSFSAFELETLELLLSRITVMLENAGLYEKIKNQAYHDGLTGLLNHLTFQQKLLASVEKKEKGEIPAISLCIMDIDFFKKFNDSFGHQEGDRVLVKIAGMLSDFEKRTPGSYCARYGGEEFVFVLEGHDIYSAANIAEQIRKFSTTHLKGGNEKEMRPINLSIGVTSYPDFAKDARELFKNADEALYLAKEEGRNAVRTTMDVRKIDRRKR
jgi:diguanylate cyclase (GGDEF)-like protein